MGVKILAIETSCDETSAAVVEDGRHVKSLVTNSQIDLHRAYGGVVPEVAARSHVEVIIPVIDQALSEAGLNKSDIDSIAVTQGPGLAGSLLIGVLTARTMAKALGKPLIAVHHILGHVYANWLTDGIKLSQPYPTRQPEFPILALIVSGGHSQLMLGKNHHDWQVIGRTTDDAVGEALDKVAKIIGLPYPGGPSIAQAALSGDSQAYRLPTPRVQDKYGFSFSGLKTAVLREVQRICEVSYDFPSFQLAERLSPDQVNDMAASFQHTAIKYLVDKTKLAYLDYQPKSLIIGGGVAASSALRQALGEAISAQIEYAPQLLCTDNAAMIGARAYYQALDNDYANPDSLELVPSWPL